MPLRLAALRPFEIAYTAVQQVPIPILAHMIGRGWFAEVPQSHQPRQRNALRVDERCREGALIVAHVEAPIVAAQPPLVSHINERQFHIVVAADDQNTTTQLFQEFFSVHLRWVVWVLLVHWSKASNALT